MPVSFGNFDYGVQDDGMHVHVAVAVHVRKIQAGSAEFFELSGDFIEKFPSRAPAKKIPQSGPGRVGWESSHFFRQRAGFPMGA